MGCFAGVDKDKIEDARDSDDARASLTALTIEAEGSADSQAPLLDELRQLGLKQLRLRAAAEGVDEDAIEDARDGDSPKEDVRLILFPRACVAQRGCLTRLLPVQIIKLIQAQAIAAGKAAEDKAAAEQAAAEQAAAAQRAALEAELQQLTVKQLRLRAKAEGVDGDALEDARDGDTPKASIIGLILGNAPAVARP